MAHNQSNALSSLAGVRATVSNTLNESYIGYMRRAKTQSCDVVCVCVRVLENRQNQIHYSEFVIVTPVEAQCVMRLGACLWDWKRKLMEKEFLIFARKPTGDRSRLKMESDTCTHTLAEWMLRYTRLFIVIFHRLNRATETSKNRKNMRW